ncbi:hypothetical protein [Zobellia galactanivorans]|uniref:hypothetical protein n=1 Tax=Zobellia galactanivorans (strain DSM 12802 / CCUG 47099 / CIP 106680 / NCIMB 13871 / Dsij) TaxID=63186 RepID=UPI00130E19E2|nr:hypothetical protein [Zobellia galactanivorans]
MLAPADSINNNERVIPMLTSLKIGIHMIQADNFIKTDYIFYLCQYRAFSNK